MNKKILLIISLFLGFCFSLSFAQNQPSLSISSILIDGNEYSKNDTINGSMEFQNHRPQNLPGVKYNISLVGSYNKLMGYYDKVYDLKTYPDIFLNGLEKKKIDFSYKIPNIDLNGDFALKVDVFTSAGIPIGSSIVKFKINGTSNVLDINDAHLEIDGARFYLQAGPSIRDSRKGFLKFSVYNSSDSLVSVVPQVKVYNRTVTGSLLGTFDSETVELKNKEKKDVSIEITNFIKEPGVYEGELVLFDSKGSIVSESILFRYIIYGNIVTIQNVSLDKESVASDDSINLTISYTGSPYDLSTGETPKQSAMKTEIVLSNYFGSVISKYFGNIDYSGKGSINVPLKALKDSKFFNLDIKIYDGDKIITHYNNNLTDSTKYDLYKNISVVIVVLIVLFVLAFIIKKKGFFNKKIIIVSLFILLSFFVSSDKTFAYDPLDYLTFTTSTGTTNLTNLIFKDASSANITTVGLKRLLVKPGQMFQVEVQALLEGCGNAKIAQVNFSDVVSGSAVYPYTYRNDPNATYPYTAGAGNGLLIIGSDNKTTTTKPDVYLHAPSTVGIYKVYFNIMTWEHTATSTTKTFDGRGYLIVQVMPNPTVTLTAASDSVLSGTSPNLTWTPTGATSCTKSGGSGLWAETVNNPVSGTDVMLVPGPISAATTYTINCVNSVGATTGDISKTINVTYSAPTVTLTATTDPIPSGSSPTLTWSSNNAVSCTKSGGSAGWAGSATLSGTQTPGAITTATTYTINCVNSSGVSTGNISKTINIIYPAPTVTLTAPNSVTSGTSPTLTWSSTDTTLCTKSGGSGDWDNSSTAISGTQTPGSITMETIYYISCTGPGGTKNISKTVYIIPTVNLIAVSDSVLSGTSPTLIWSSTDTNSCTKSGGSGSWSGAVATAGSETPGAISTTTVYNISCVGAGGTVSANKTITVTYPDPDVKLTAVSDYITKGTTPTLIWTPTNSTKCTKSGGSGTWAETVNNPVNGTDKTETPGAILTSTTYTINCSNLGGNTTENKSVTINIKSDSPVVSLTAVSESIPSGTSPTLTWNAYNSSSCVRSGGSAGWVGTTTVATSTFSTTTIPGVISTTTTYTINCVNADKESTGNISKTIYIKPTVTLMALSESIPSGSSPTLIWTALSSASCIKSGGSAGWAGTTTIPTSPFYATTTPAAISTSTTYTINCANAGGDTTGNISKTITITNIAPSVTLTGPDFVLSGNAPTLTWTASSSVSCTRLEGSAGWAGTTTVPTSPYFATTTPGAIIATTTYTINCTNAANAKTPDVSKVVGITTAQLDPTVILMASSYSIPKGDSPHLTWRPTNSTECIKSGGSGNWAETVNNPISGVDRVEDPGPIISTTIYSISCTGGGKTVNKSISISVNASTYLNITSNPCVESDENPVLTVEGSNLKSCQRTSSPIIGLPWDKTTYIVSNPFSTTITSSLISQPTKYIISCAALTPGVTLTASTTVSICPPSVTRFYPTCSAWQNNVASTGTIIVDGAMQWKVSGIPAGDFTVEKIFTPSIGMDLNSPLTNGTLSFGDIYYQQTGIKNFWIKLIKIDNGDWGECSASTDAVIGDPTIVEH
ncbi:MAG: hypothetical protein WC827_03385 [Candidatus Paceibacterota bacterium]|jgi:hypothetical protein